MTLRLHEARRHEHVIALIEAALIHGQSQPWMYEVLALSMEVAGRPKDEVERVLLSGIDFNGADYLSMMYSAAYLVRFGRPAPALRLYRQAARLDPHRPEPYLLGLKLARQLKDPASVGWAAAGILETAWIKNHEQLHRQAEQAALDAKDQLQQAGREKEATVLAAALEQARRRDLVLRLDWSGHGDLDLVVEEPHGSVCSFDNPLTPGGGALVHDGYGPDQANCYEHYVCARGVPGNYRVRIRHVAGNIVGKRAQLTVTRYRGTPAETSETFAIPLTDRDTIVRLGLAEGRRTELAEVPEAALSRNVRPRRRPTLLEMLGSPDAGTRRAQRDFQSSRNRAAAGTPGFTPIVSVLSEGATLQAMAVISGDRRYVRLTPAPVFSTITDVFTFSFQNGGGNPTGNPGVGSGGQGTPGGFTGTNVGGIP
ncbi:MAG: hypothetical protein KY476_18045 [Planctomycetes bacterium]|nr:hypothetical protein [Planctomycetota bacterium]